MRCACAPGKKEAAEPSAWGWGSVWMLFWPTAKLPDVFQPDKCLGLVRRIYGEGAGVLLRKDFAFFVDRAKNYLLYKEN